jgi:heat shock protein 1/8
MGGKKKSSGNSKPAAPAPAVSAEAKAAAKGHKDKGNTAFSAAKYEEAVNHFTLAILEDPTDHVFYSNRSASYANLGDHDKAAEDGVKCVQLNSKWAKGYSRLGLARFRQNNLKEAKKIYETGLTIEPDNASLKEGLQEVLQAMKEARAKVEAEVNKAKGGVDAMNLNDKRENIIGIDLGTTYSCVAVWRNGEAEVLTNSEGDRTTASWVSFTDDQRIVGDSAKRQAAMNPERTLFNIKRLIGRHHGDCHADLKHMPFKVTAGDGGKPVIAVDVGGGGGTKKYFPEQISAMVLEKMKATAELALGEPVKKAVITVPAYFNDSQRRLTKDAGTIAGLDVVRIINEPTAAALAYGLDKRVGQEGGLTSQTTLVFDLGGGTFDVSLLKLESGMFEVLATAGDTHLGGEDFDSAIADWVLSELKRKSKTQGEMYAGNHKAQRKIRAAAENAKRQLSFSTTATIQCTIGDDEISMEITRAKFEKLCEPVFQKCLDSVKSVLEDAKVDQSAVDEIVLVGGSTRVPRVQTILQDFFNGKQLCKAVHPDEAVALGAAVQGAILSGVRDAATQALLLVDVIPLSLGVECEGKHFAKVVPRNTSIPCKKTSEFTTVEDWQTEIDIRVFEGERSHTDGNNLLGEFSITGVQKARQGEAKVEVTFEVNANGLLTVTARDKETNARADIEIAHDRGRLSNEEIERMCAEAERFRMEDEARTAAAEARAYAGRGAGDDY